MTTLIQIALLAGVSYLLVSVGMDMLRKYTYEQLSERYGLQLQMENRLPEPRLKELKENGASRWTYRRLIRQYVTS